MKRPLVLLPLVLLVAGCSGDEQPVVRVEEAVRATVQEVVDAPGTITAKATSTVTAPADATVAQLAVRDGATVAKGAVLVRLDSPAAQERLRQARQAQASAQTRVQLPQTDLGPVQDSLDAAAHEALAAGRAAAAKLPDPAARTAALADIARARSRYQAAAAAARTAVGSVGEGVGSLEAALNAVGSRQRSQAEALVTTAQATVDALVVTAPQAGVVTYGATGSGGGGAPALDGLIEQLPAEVQGQAEGALGGGSAPAPQTQAQLAVGVAVSSGDPLLTVTDVSGLGVTAEVDETDVLLVRPGVAAGVELDAVPDADYSATVTSVDVAPTSSSGGGVSYRVRLSLRPGRTPDGARSPQPRPGMSAVVDLRVREARSALTVPSAAVVRDGEADTVFVQTGSTYARRVVVLGAVGEDRVQVAKGLGVGDRVVVEGADRVRDGQEVA